MFELIGLAGVIIASNRVRFDLVATIVVLALLLSCTLATRRAFAGSASLVVIIVAAFLAIGGNVGNFDNTGSD